MHNIEAKFNITFFYEYLNILKTGFIFLRRKQDNKSFILDINLTNAKYSEDLWDKIIN